MTRHHLIIHTAVVTLSSVSCIAFDGLLKSALFTAVGITIGFTVSFFVTKKTTSVSLSQIGDIIYREANLVTKNVTMMDSS